jgi:cytochrome P450
MVDTQPLKKQFNIDDSSIAADPYPTYDELRAECPVGHTDYRGGYFYVTDYQSVRTAFRSPELFSSAQIKIPFIDEEPEIPLQLDGAEHAKWRALLDPLFSMSRMDRYISAIRAEAIGLLEDFVAAGGGDLASAFTIPFPSRNFCLIMGLAASSLDEYLNLQRDLSNVAATARHDLDNRTRAMEAYNRARDGVHTIFENLRSKRFDEGMRDDVVSFLLTAEIDGSKLTLEEFHNVCVLLFSAGLETVTATLGNFFWYFAEHPEQWQRLIDDPTLIPKAVEEMLRFESVVSTGRLVQVETELAGTKLCPGNRLLLITGAADRDPAVFENPDDVDFGRSPNRHLAFGGGPHRCLGSHLARMELRIALEEATRLMPKFGLTPGAKVVRTLGQIKAFDVLPLTVG